MTRVPQATKRRKSRVSESQLRAAELFFAAEDGNPTAQFRFAEAIARGDLPAQLQPTVRRIMLDRFTQAPGVVEQFTTKLTVTGIDRNEEFGIYGFNQDNVPDQNMGQKFIPGTMPAVGNREGYPQLGLQGSGRFYQANKHGLQFGIDWEAIVNSRGTDVNLIRDSMEAYGDYAAGLVETKPLQNLFTATGFNTTKLGTGGVVAGNPSIDNIQVIIDAVAKAQAVTVNNVDTPAAFTDFVLLVDPAILGAVKQVMSARRVTRVPARTGTGSTGISNEVEEILDLGATVTPVASPWIRKVFPGIGRGWVLIPTNWGRPGLTRNYLQGFEEPQLFVKSTDARSLNGAGESSPEDGDFDSDSVRTKSRFVYGSSLLWNEGIVWSAGTNA